ncbi:MAG: AsmA family protein, partial [Chloroflexi bacterium]|nr:AsmA family protein [Chloroflexota bacterium]
MNSALAKIFRRLIYGLLLLSAILVILVSIFLSHFDLDNYRQELETTLGKALEQPVAIGYSKLTFNKGIALRFHDLRIGPEAAPLALIPDLTATLKIAPLFDGKIILDQVDIDNPSLQLWLPFLTRVERGTAHQLTDELGIHILRVHDAKLQIHRRSPEGPQELLCIDDLNLVLQGWQANRSAQLVISGQLQQEQKPAEFLLNMILPSSPDPAV